MTDKSGYNDILNKFCTKLNNAIHMPLQTLIFVLKNMGFVGKLKDHQIEDVTYLYYETSHPFIMDICWNKTKKLYMVSEFPHYEITHISFSDIKNVVAFCIYRMTQLTNTIVGYIYKCFSISNDIKIRYMEFDSLMSKWKSQMDDISMIHDVDTISHIVHESNIFSKIISSEDCSNTSTNLRYLLNPLCNDAQIKVLNSILYIDSNDILLEGYDSESLSDFDDIIV